MSWREKPWSSDSRIESSLVNDCPDNFNKSPIAVTNHVLWLSLYMDSQTNNAHKVISFYL